MPGCVLVSCGDLSDAASLQGDELGLCPCPGDGHEGERGVVVLGSGHGCELQVMLCADPTLLLSDRNFIRSSAEPGDDVLGPLGATALDVGDAMEVESGASWDCPIGGRDLPSLSMLR